MFTVLLVAQHGKEKHLLLDKPQIFRLFTDAAPFYWVLPTNSKNLLLFEYPIMGCLFLWLNHFTKWVMFMDKITGILWSWAYSTFWIARKVCPGTKHLPGFQLGARLFEFCVLLQYNTTRPFYFQSFSKLQKTDIFTDCFFFLKRKFSFLGNL